jgi:hypothetical protein
MELTDKHESFDVLRTTPARYRTALGLAALVPGFFIVVAPPLVILALMLGKLGAAAAGPGMCATGVVYGWIHMRPRMLKRHSTPVLLTINDEGLVFSDGASRPWSSILYCNPPEKDRWFSIWFQDRSEWMLGPKVSDTLNAHDRLKAALVNRLRIHNPGALIDD